MAGCRHHGSLRKVRSAIRALSRTGVDVACVIAKSPPLLSPRYPPRGGTLAPPVTCWREPYSFRISLRGPVSGFSGCDPYYTVAIPAPPHHRGLGVSPGW